MNADAHGFFVGKIKATIYSKWDRLWEMIATAKSFLFRLGIKSLLALVLTFPVLVSGQGTFNAISYYAPTDGSYAPSVIGIVNGGVGWFFVPTLDLSVTAIYSSGQQVSFWLGTNQSMVTYNYTNSSFQPIPPLLLSAGQAYFISAQNSNFTTMNILNFSSQGQYGIPTFTNSPYLTQFGNYELSQSGQWSPNPGSPPANSDFFYLGPNFQFEVVPEPTSSELLILAAVVFGGLFFCRRGASNSFYVC